MSCSCWQSGLWDNKTLRVEPADCPDKTTCAADTYPMLVQSCNSVYDAGPTLNRQWVSVSCFWTSRSAVRCSRAKSRSLRLPPPRDCITTASRLALRTLPVWGCAGELLWNVSSRPDAGQTPAQCPHGCTDFQTEFCRRLNLAGSTARCFKVRSIFPRDRKRGHQTENWLRFATCLRG